MRHWMRPSNSSWHAFLGLLAAGSGWCLLAAGPRLGDLGLHSAASLTKPSVHSSQVSTTASTTTRAEADTAAATVTPTSSAVSEDDPTRSEPTAPEGQQGQTLEAEGPWGVLQSFYVYIAAPDHVLQHFQVPSATTSWNFYGKTPDDVTALLDRPGIPAEHREALLDRSRWLVHDDQIQVTPSRAAVLSLPPGVRSALYQVLARWEANEFQNAPYFIPGGDIDSWVRRSGLREELVDAIRKTAYPIGKATCFSDVSLLVSLTTTHSEARDLLKVLSRTRTAILRLRLDERADIERIRRYWSAGESNQKDFVPLLESIATNPAVNYLDIVHLLPPYARKLAYTYPHASHAVGGRYPDCHWTCLNFFNYRPEGRLVDTEGARIFVLENFAPGEEPYRYGDVLFLVDEDGNAIHSCVYLADDFVFTKNGSNLISPWLIMKLSEVVDRYSVQSDPAIRIYRRQ
jgi:hypothetical protein